MPLIRRKRSPYWYADLRGIGGGVVSTKLTDKRAALLELSRLERAQAQAADPATRPLERHLLSEALQLVLDGAADGSTHYEARCAWLLAGLGSIPLEQLTAADLSKYLAWRRTPKGGRGSDSTIVKEFNALHKALALAKRAGWWRGDWEAIRPLWKPKVVVRERVLTTAEVKRLLPQLLPHRQLWLLVALYTGGRQLEVERLDWSRVDLAQGLLWLDGTKTEGSRRQVPIAAGLRALLEAVNDKKRKGRVVGAWSNAWGDLREAAERAGVPPFNLLDVRRSCATWLADQGATDTQVARVLGHTTTRMAKAVYVKHSAQALQPQLDTLPELQLVEPAPINGRKGYRKRSVALVSQEDAAEGGKVRPVAREPRKAKAK